MNLYLKYLGIGLGSLALLPATTARELPSAADVSFTHPVLDEAYVSSPFGMRTDPFRQRPSWHGGLDLGAKWDAPIHAPANGKIVYADTRAGYGKMVDLQVSDGWVIRFAHMSDINVAVDDEVSAGDVIGEVGSTNRSTGPHLHLETRYAEKQYNPLRLDGLRLFATEKTRPN